MTDLGRDPRFKITGYSSLRMATEALAPIRLAPASIIARASASVRMPPAALTPMSV